MTDLQHSLGRPTSEHFSEERESSGVTTMEIWERERRREKELCFSLLMMTSEMSVVATNLAQET